MTKEELDAVVELRIAKAYRAEDVLPNIEPTGKLLDVVVAKARELIIN